MLRYGTDEYRALVRKNRDKQTEFLNKQNKIAIERIFQDKGVRDKLKIEIGYQELTLKIKEKKKAKNGQDMMVVKFWKAPKTNIKALKESYDPITCYHMLQRENRGEFDDNWYKSFTYCLTEQDFDKVKKGDKFRCLIQHKEKYFTEKDGTLVRYEQGNRYGEPIIIREASIAKIYKEGEEPQIDYLKLFIPLNDGTDNI